MKAEFVNPFLEATSIVFKNLLQADILRGKTSIKASAAPSHEIAIIIGVTGKFAGQVVYSMNIFTAYKIARKLMPGTSDAIIRKEFRDVLGEIGNMITGNALNLSANLNEDVDLTVPMVVDTNLSKLTFKKTTTLGLNLYSRFGLMEVNIAFG